MTDVKNTFYLYQRPFDV